MTLNDYEKKHLAFLRGANPGCTLFLKRNRDFPLEEAGSIALYGSGVRHTVKGGTGSGEVNSRFFTTVEEGIRQAGFSVTTEDWLDRYDRIREEAHRRFLRELTLGSLKKRSNPLAECMGAIMPEPEYDLPVTKTCDTAVYVLSRISGEGNDRQVIPGDVLLSRTEQRDILAIAAMYPRFLLVLNVGGPVDLSPVADGVENILLLSQLGVETGAILADILLGKANPSGKLSTTWAAAGEYCGLGDFGGREQTRYREGIYVGYRFFDTVGKRAMFPFGFGLSYTDFSMACGGVEVNKNEIAVTARVTNTGRFSGREVVQLYVSCPEGKLDQPYQVLAGFAKTPVLAPGETGSVTIRFGLESVASYDAARAAWVLEQGDYILRLGSSSVSTEEAAAVRLEATVVTRRVKNLLGRPDFEDWRPERRPVTCHAPVFPMAAADIPRTETDYDVQYPIDPAVKRLTDEELMYLNIGAFRSGSGVSGIIGEASTTVAGAAGETCGRLKDKGFPVLVMADGPAGVRLARRYYTDEAGAHALGQTMPETMLALLPGPVQRILNRPPKLKPGTQIKEQFATAIPIGTAIAQSFDTDYAERCGDLVGSEMERFGVHLWLAPALNIHRSILCGRNFEYYSEDPLLSGLMAAALTRGVQRHPGRGVTVKHFAANNQETNRYNSNSLVSERAMREIYLKGFEICIRLSQPKAVMTSYNLLNGVHTSERRDLTEELLRREFGFRGIVMTDWVLGGKLLYNSKIYPMPNAGKVAMAGGDLFMPGSKGDYNRCLRLLRSGPLSRVQLEISATRLLHLARELTK